MKRNSIDWDSLKLVLTIARAGNFSKAARLLGVAQTTIGRQLTDLENQLGVTLFIRSRTTMTPNEHGESILKYAEQMESAAISAIDEVGLTRIAPTGVIRFQIMGWIFNRILSPKLPDFMARFPGISLQAIVDQRLRYLDKDETQLSLRFDMPPRGRAESTPLVQIPYGIYGQKGVDPESLPWLAFREDQIEVKVESWMKQRKLDGEVVFWTNDTEMLYHAARDGCGKTLIPSHLGDSDQNLECYSGSEPVLIRTLNMHSLPETLKLKRIATFIEWMIPVLEAQFERY